MVPDHQWKNAIKDQLAAAGLTGGWGALDVQYNTYVTVLASSVTFLECRDIHDIFKTKDVHMNAPCKSLQGEIDFSHHINTKGYFWLF